MTFEFTDYHQTRREIPKWDSLSIELAYVVDYNPETESCTLCLGGRHGGTYLYNVPIAVDFGGCYEVQQKMHQPCDRAKPDQYGKVERGPRWGVSYPVQVGDTCVVGFVSGNESTPVILKFLRGWSDPGIGWVAKKVEREGEGFPETDQQPAHRFDICLPSGGWLRCLSDSSWVVSTAPLNKPKALITLHANGDIDILAEGEIRIKAQKKIIGIGQTGIDFSTPESITATAAKDIDITAGDTPRSQPLENPLTSPESLAQSLMGAANVQALAQALNNRDLLAVAQSLPQQFLKNAPLPINTNLFGSLDLDTFFSGAVGSLGSGNLGDFLESQIQSFGNLAIAQDLLTNLSEGQIQSLVQGLLNQNLQQLVEPLTQLTGKGRVNIRAGNAITQRSTRQFNIATKLQETLMQRLAKGVVIHNNATNVIDNNAPLTRLRALCNQGHWLGVIPSGWGRIVCPNLEINP